MHRVCLCEPRPMSHLFNSSDLLRPNSFKDLIHMSSCVFILTVTNFHNKKHSSTLEFTPKFCRGKWAHSLGQDCFFFLHLLLNKQTSVSILDQLWLAISSFLLREVQMDKSLRCWKLHQTRLTAVNESCTLSDFYLTETIKVQELRTK